MLMMSDVITHPPSTTLHHTPPQKSGSIGPYITTALSCYDGILSRLVEIKILVNWGMVHSKSYCTSIPLPLYCFGLRYRVNNSKLARSIPKFHILTYYLKHEQQCFIRYKVTLDLIKHALRMFREN
jgi:hypothetical protein